MYKRPCAEVFELKYDYEGGMFILVQGLAISKIPFETFSKVINLFKRVNCIVSNDHYFFSRTSCCNLP